MSGISLFWTMQAAALDMTLEAAAGYDDNVTSSRDAAGSGFGAYRISLGQPFFSGTQWIGVDAFIDVSYQDYFQADDNYQFKAGGLVSGSLAGGRILPGLMYEAKFYRDDEAEWDETNEHRLKGQLEWLMSGRFTLGIRQAWTWQEYCNPVEILQQASASDPQHPMLTCRRVEYETPHSHHGNMKHENMKHGNMKHENMKHGNMKHENMMEENQQQTISRDDRLSQSSFKITAYLSPDLEADVSLTHNRLSSSIKAESYRENSISFSVGWFPDDLWKISAMTSWKDAEYDFTSESPDRSDTIRAVSVGISRFINKYELFVHAEWLDNDSSLEKESYHQMVTQCGVSLSF